MQASFNLLGREIPLYGLMIASGVLLGGYLGSVLAKKFKLNYDFFLVLAGYCFGFGIIGAKLLYLFVMRDKIQWDRILELPYFAALMQGGFVFYGGLLLGGAGLLLGSKLHRIPLAPYLYTMIPCLPLVHAFGRIGCYFAGCCYGIPYTGFFHVIYPENGISPSGLPLFPVQLLEAAINLIILLVLLLLIYNKGVSIVNLIIYLLSYSIARFILEYFRYDYVERGNYLFFSTSQWVSLLIAAACLIYLFLKKNIKPITVEY